MNNKRQTLNIDLSKNNYQSVWGIRGEKGVRDIDIYVLENGSIFDLTDIKAMFYCDAVDGSKIFKDVEIINSELGQMLLEVPQQLLSKNGLNKCCLAFTKEEDLLLSFNFTLIVKDSVFDENAIVASDDFSALTKALEDVGNFDTLKKDFDEHIANHPVGGGGGSSHEHSNLTTLNKITETKITEWDNINVVEEEIDEINANIDYLHNLQYVPSTGTNVKSDYSLAGKTKDMSIKGRTLQNLGSIQYCNLPAHATVIDTNIITMPIQNHRYNNFNIPKTMFKPSTTYTLFVNMIQNNSSPSTIEGEVEQGYAFSLLSYDNDHSRSIVKSSSNGSYACIFKPREVGLKKCSFITHDLAEFNEEKRISVNFELQTYYSATSGEQKFQILILEGDYTNTPLNELPYIEGIQGVGDLTTSPEGEVVKVEVKSCGKNLFSKGTHKIDENGKIVCDYKVNSDIYYTKLFLDKGNYHILVNNIEKIGSNPYCRYDIIKGENKILDYQGIELSSGRGVSKFTISDSGTYIIGFGAGEGVNNNYFKGNILISKDTASNSYEPYVEDTLTYTLEEQLHRLPNGVCDEIVDGKLIRRVGKIILDGSEDWILERSNNELGLILCRLEKISKHNTPFICDNRLYASGYDWAANNVNTIWNYSEHIYLCLKASTINEFKETLQENPTTVYYELKTPVVTELDKPTNLDTYVGTTHITSSNTVLPTIEGKIRTNLASALAGAKAENQVLNIRTMNLEVENKELKNVNNIQDELIDVSMLATDELYNMIEPMLPQTMNKTLFKSEVRSPMVDMYVAMVQRGLKTIEEVPSRYRESVAKILAQLDN